jgi:hypothetical protein
MQAPKFLGLKGWTNSMTTLTNWLRGNFNGGDKAIWLDDGDGVPDGAEHRGTFHSALGYFLCQLLANAAIASSRVSAYPRAALARRT